MIKLCRNIERNMEQHSGTLCGNSKIIKKVAEGQNCHFLLNLLRHKTVYIRRISVSH